jgi:hypothetical protein
MTELKRPDRDPDLHVEPDRFGKKALFWWDEMLCARTYYSGTEEVFRMIATNDMYTVYFKNYGTLNSIVKEAYLSWLAEKELLR